MRDSKRSGTKRCPRTIQPVTRAGDTSSAQKRQHYPSSNGQLCHQEKVDEAFQYFRFTHRAWRPIVRSVTVYDLTYTRQDYGSGYIYKLPEVSMEPVRA